MAFVCVGDGDLAHSRQSDRCAILQRDKALIPVVTTETSRPLHSFALLDCPSLPRRVAVDGEPAEAGSGGCERCH